MPGNKYVFQPTTLSDLIQDPHTMVVIDTNVLLAAYQWRDVTVTEIIKSLKRLSDENRLCIPSHVAREFSKRRPKLIAEMIQGIDQEISRIQTHKNPLHLVPTLSGTDEFEVASASFKSLLEHQKAYKSALGKLRDKLLFLFDEDHVLMEYATIMEKSFYSPPSLPNEDELIKEAKERFLNKIPPGYKDAGKSENDAGDYIIWRHILELNTSAIYVSLETKSDWAITDQHDRVISARRELIEEFFDKTQGKSFALVSPRVFFPLLEPHLDESVKADLSESEERTSRREVLESMWLQDDDRQKVQIMIDQAFHPENSRIANELYAKAMRFAESRIKHRKRESIESFLGAHLSQLIAIDKHAYSEARRMIDELNLDTIRELDLATSLHGIRDWILDRIAASGY